MLTNISENHEDNGFILNTGLTVADDKFRGLGVRGKGYSALLELAENKQMFRNLYFSQKYVSWIHFLTHTCNQKTNFGTPPIKNWIDSGEWKINYPNFYNL